MLAYISPAGLAGTCTRRKSCGSPCTSASSLSAKSRRPPGACPAGGWPAAPSPGSSCANCGRS